MLNTATDVFGVSQIRSDVDHGSLALLYGILALGSLREQTYDSLTKQYRTVQRSVTDNLSSNSPSSPESLPSFTSRATAQCLLRLAQDELDSIDQPSETAVQALFVLHTFVSNTSMGRRSRDYVARAIMMAHELGLNRRMPIGLSPTDNLRDAKHNCRRRAMIYLYVYFSDV